MATDQRNLIAYFNANADFQGWCQGLAAQLVAAGWVKTADTGQINNTTVLAPGGNNASQGYEIYRLNDTLQATVPVFLKIEYGSSGNGQYYPGLWVTVGSGSNGAGTLTGQLSTRRQLGAYTATVGTYYPSYCCGDGSGMALVTNYNSASTNQGMAVVIDRSRDGSGAATADGVYIFTTSYSYYSMQVVPATGAVPAGTASVSGLAPWTYSPAEATSTYSLGLGTVGNNVAVVPVLLLLGRLLFSKMAHIALAASVSALTATVVQTLGGSHTYLPVALNVPVSSGVVAGDMTLMLWE